MTTYAYLISIVDWDTHMIKYVTLSKGRANELFEVVRAELIEQAKDQIEHLRKDAEQYDGGLSYVQEWEQYIVNLTKIKPGEDWDVSGERPIIEKIEITE